MIIFEGAVVFDAIKAVVATKFTRRRAAIIIKIWKARSGWYEGG